MSDALVFDSAVPYLLSCDPFEPVRKSTTLLSVVRTILKISRRPSAALPLRLRAIVWEHADVVWEISDSPENIH